MVRAACGNPVHVPRESRRGLGVPELGGDIGQRGALGQQVRGEGVPQVVEPEAGQTRCLEPRPRRPSSRSSGRGACRRSRGRSKARDHGRPRRHRPPARLGASSGPRPNAGSRPRSATRRSSCLRSRRLLPPARSPGSGPWIPVHPAQGQQLPGPRPGVCGRQDQRRVVLGRPCLSDGKEPGELLLGHRANPALAVGPRHRIRPAPAASALELEQREMPSGGFCGGRAASTIRTRAGGTSTLDHAAVPPLALIDTASVSAPVPFRPLLGSRRNRTSRLWPVSCSAMNLARVETRTNRCFPSAARVRP